MHRLVCAFATSIAVACSGAASAADLSSFLSPQRPRVTQNWTGLYAGLNVGYGWGTNANPGMSFIEGSGTGLTGYIAAGGIVPVAANPEGIIGGGQFGYNVQTGNLVWGLVTDFQASGMKQSTTVVTAPPAFVIGSTTMDRKLDWFGTLRGKLGWAASPTWLLYGTGGLAYGHVKDTLTFISSGAPFASGSSSTTRVGWTLGAGIELGFAPWSVGLEYLYMDLGSSDVTMTFGGYAGAGLDSVTMSSKNESHLFRAVMNYRF